MDHGSNQKEKMVLSWTKKIIKPHNLELFYAKQNSKEFKFPQDI